MSGNNQNDKQQISLQTGPSTSELLKIQSNGQILVWVLNYLEQMSQDKEKKMIIKVRNFIAMLSAVIILKSVIEEPKFTNWKLTDLSIFKYYMQRFYYKEKICEIMFVNKKWAYINRDITEQTKNLSTPLLTSYFEKQGISIAVPGTYYFSVRGFLVKVTISEIKILIQYPHITHVVEVFDKLLREVEEIVQASKTCMIRIGVSESGSLQVLPQKMTYTFETENYSKLRELITINFNATKRFGFPKLPLPVIFDGEPGMGKTTFGNYIAAKGDVDLVMVVNLTQWIKDPLSTVIERIGKQIDQQIKDKEKLEDQTVLLILDELDKYFESYIKEQINKLQDEVRTAQSKLANQNTGTNNNNNSNNSNNSNNNANQNVVVPQPLSEQEIEAKRQTFKDNFLSTLYKICEGLSSLGNDRNYVIICNTNNIDKIFGGIDKKSQFYTVYKRFHKYSFPKIKKPEIVAFIENIRTKQEDDEREENISYDDIPENIQMTYRDLMQNLTKCTYKISELIETLKDERNWDKNEFTDFK